MDHKRLRVDIGEEPENLSLISHTGSRATAPLTAGARWSPEIRFAAELIAAWQENRKPSSVPEIMAGARKRTGSRGASWASAAMRAEPDRVSLQSRVKEMHSNWP
jgi:hypothetical protein